MKRPIFFDMNELDLVVFKDLESDGDFYGMENEVRNELVNLRKKYGSKESHVPEGHTITVFPFEFSGQKDEYTDLYKVVNKRMEFPVNRIEWIFIRIIYR